MQKPFNIVVAVGWSSYNKGDAAILLGLLKTIKEFYPESKISILSSSPKEDRKYYSKYGDTHERLFNTFYKKKPKIVNIVIVILKILYYLIWSTNTNIPIIKSDKEILNLYRKADLVISGGGGYLGGNKIFNAVAFLFPLYVAKKIGKKVYVCAQSVEPFNNWITKFITMFFLNRIDLITVREPYSIQTLKSAHIKKPVYLTADTAFLLDAESVDVGYHLLNKSGVPRDNKLRIGITVTKWNFPRSKDPTIKQLQYVTSIADAIEEIIKEMDATIVFFPNAIFPPKDDDRIISHQIKEKIKELYTKNVFVLTEDYSPEQLKSMISTMDVFIGTRMHSNIFATSMNVPTLAIAYEKKHYGIMEMIGLQDYVIDISNINTEQLVMLVKKLIENRELVQQILKNGIALIKKRAIQNVEMMNDLLK